MGRVLVIDSDPAVRDALAACLEFEAHTVCATPDLAGGLQLLADEPFDLVVADLFWARGLGPTAPAADVIAEVAPAVPLVVTTTLTQAEGLDPAAYGLAGIVVKPFAIDDLLHCVARVLAAQHQRIRELRLTADQARAQLDGARLQLEQSARVLRKLGLA